MRKESDLDLFICKTGSRFKRIAYADFLFVELDRTTNKAQVVTEKGVKEMIDFNLPNSDLLIPYVPTPLPTSTPYDIEQGSVELDWNLNYKLPEEKTINRKN